MTMLTSGMTSSDSREWGTPDHLYNPLHEVYDFTLDGAASHANAKVDRYCTKDGTFQRVEGVCRCVSAAVLPGGSVLHGSKCPLNPLNAVTAVAPGIHAARISDLDGLEFPWRDERVFLNPPWGDPVFPCAPTAKLDHRKSCEARGAHALEYEPGIEDFLRKTRNESLRNRAIVVAVIPARMDTGWMHDLVLPYARVRWIRGRPKFVDPTGQERDAPPVGVGIAVYR